MKSDFKWNILIFPPTQHHGDKVPYSPLAMSNYDMSMPPPTSKSSSTKPPSTTTLTLPKTTSANQILSSGSSHFGNNRRNSHKTAHHRYISGPNHLLHWRQNSVKTFFSYFLGFHLARFAMCRLRCLYKQCITSH